MTARGEIDDIYASGATAILRIESGDPDGPCEDRDFWRRSLEGRSDSTDVNSLV